MTMRRRSSSFCSVFVLFLLRLGPRALGPHVLPGVAAAVAAVTAATVSPPAVAAAVPHRVVLVVLPAPTSAPAHEAVEAQRRVGT